MNRLKIAQYIALGGLALVVIGFLLDYVTDELGFCIMLIGLVVGWVSYLFGGLLTAIKMAGKIAKIGWFIVPFPWDLMTFALTFILAGFLLLFVPIIPIRKAYKESM